MDFRKIISVALTFSLGAAVVSCGNKKGESGQSESAGTAETEFREIWTGNEQRDLSSGDRFELSFGKEIGLNNYVRFTYSSECYVDATMYFVETNGESEYSERFFLSPGETEFRQILNYYNNDYYKKTLEKIEFRCVGEKSGSFSFTSVGIASHSIPFSTVNFSDPFETEDCMQLFLVGENVKLGVNLKNGGAIDYLSSLNEGIGLSRTLNGEVFVGHGGDEILLEDDVNLINAHDTGRLVQQSYYGTRGDSIADPKDDYHCGKYEHDGNLDTPPVEWPYNPVQGGDQYLNFGQLIDVQVTETSVYVKCRPMDWAKNGSVTPFYMENRYTIEEDPVFGEYVKVENKCTDFSGYVHNNVRDQELPAFYGITPLGTMATYKGDKPWQNAEPSYNSDLPFWSPGGPDSRFNATENWIGWVNDDHWGIGLYVPDVQRMLAGRAGYSVSFDEIGIEPSQAAPTTYVAPLGVFSMPVYESFGYAYYLKLDYVDGFRAFFSSLHKGGAVNEDILRLENR